MQSDAPLPQILLGVGLGGFADGIVLHQIGDDATAWDLGFLALALLQLGAGAAMARRRRLSGAPGG